MIRVLILLAITLAGALAASSALARQSAVGNDVIVADRPDSNTDLWLSRRQSGAGTGFIVADQPDWNQEPLVARRREPLLVQTIQAPRVVRLGAPVTINVGLASAIKLEAGTLLFAAYFGSDQLFCAPGKRSALAEYSFACLIDNDRDGLFEKQAWGAGAREPGGQLFGPTTDGRLKDFALANSGEALAQPIPYMAADYHQGPATKLEFQWNLKLPPDGGLHGAKLSVWAWAGATSGHLPIASRIVTTTLDDQGRAEIEVEGARFEILGVGHDGNLRYRVAHTASGRTIHFVPPGGVVTIYTTM